MKEENNLKVAKYNMINDNKNGLHKINGYLKLITIL